MSYTNRVQAYNAKMRVFGADSATDQNTTQNDSTGNSTDEQFVSFAFYESVSEAKKDNYPGGLAFAHDASLNSGVIFKEGSIVSSKVLDIKVEGEALPQELSASTVAKAQKITVSYVDDNGNVATAEFSTVNQDFVKEFVNVVSADSELANSISNFLKETDNVSAACEQIENLFEVKTSANEAGFVSYEISFDYAALSEKIKSDLQTDFTSLQNKDSELESAIEQITNEIAGLTGDSSFVEDRVSAIEDSYVKNVSVLTAVEESSLTDTVEVSISQKSGSSSDVQFEVPSDEFYQEYGNLKDNVSLIETAVGELETGVQTLSASQETLSQKLDSSVEEIYSHMGEEIERVENLVNEAVSGLESSIGDIKSDLNDVNNSVSELSVAQTEISGQISGINDEISSLSGKLDASYVELVEKISDEKDALVSEIESVEEKVLDVSANVDELSESVSERIDLNAENIQSVSADLNEFKADIQEKFNNAIIDIEELMKKVSEQE